ncbi:DoxX family protein [Salinicola halimionae]|uniref:DoxX family protein n=1 Tax=Salinicola halimionae TaxID=1949081 RepID=UPI000DA20BA8|nr:DoxX family protein [Salinicola halimionae]
MNLTSARNPRWVSALVARPGLLMLARTGLASAYLIGGLDKLWHFEAAMQEQAHFGLHPAGLWATLAVVIELTGSLSIIFNRGTWLGAGALGCLTLVAMLVANDFWNLTGQARFMALNGFFEHLGLISALILVTRLSDIRLSDTPFSDTPFSDTPLSDTQLSETSPRERA